MKTIKDRLSFPYKATYCETMDEMAKVTQRLVLNDGPLFAVSHVADAVAHGVAKHSKSDWRERDGAYFLPKILRHLRQHYGGTAFADALKGSCLTYEGGEYLDAESGVPHLAKAATNILMALENCSNEEVAPEVCITPEELGMVYLAQPYSINPELSYQLAKEISAGAVADGIAIYSPVAYGHLIAPNASYDYWLSHGIDMLRSCDSLVIVEDSPLGPSDDSPGVQRELATAEAYGLPVYKYSYSRGKLERL